MLESPARDSKANGAAERAARAWAGQLSTIRYHVERRIKVSIQKVSAIMSWLVPWAADVILICIKCIQQQELAMSGPQDTDAISQLQGSPRISISSSQPTRNTETKLTQGGPQVILPESAERPPSIRLQQQMVFSHALQSVDCRTIKPTT